MVRLYRELSEIAEHLASALGVPSSKKAEMSSTAHVTLAVLQKEIDSSIVAIEQTITILKEVQTVIADAQIHGTDDTEVNCLYCQHLCSYFLFCETTLGGFLYEGTMFCSAKAGKLARKMPRQTSDFLLCLWEACEMVLTILTVVQLPGITAVFYIGAVTSCSTVYRNAGALTSIEDFRLLWTSNQLARSWLYSKGLQLAFFGVYLPTLDTKYF